MAEMSKQKLIDEVNFIVRQIGAREKLGTERDEAVSDQAKVLLQTFSKLDGDGIESKTVNAVIDHITRTKVWDLTWLAAFKAVLNATRLHQPNSNKQTMEIQHALTQTDWNKLCGVPNPIPVSEMYEMVATRMHRYGIVCPDATLLARAGAIVEICSEMQPTNEESSELEIERILNRLNKSQVWPFDHIQHYPTNLNVLPAEVLDHACGRGERAAGTPPSIKGPAFKRIVNRILATRLAGSAHKVGGKGQSIHKGVRSGRKTTSK